MYKLLSDRVTGSPVGVVRVVYMAQLSNGHLSYPSDKVAEARADLATQRLTYPTHGMDTCVG
jgi:hypothetical protein